VLFTRIHGFQNSRIGGEMRKGVEGKCADVKNYKMRKVQKKNALGVRICPEIWGENRCLTLRYAMYCVE